MSRQILFVVTSHARTGKTDWETGLWLGEFAEPYEIFTAAGFEMNVVSPSGGEIPVDPVSLKPENLSPETLEFQQSGDPVLRQTVPLKMTDFLLYNAIFYPGGHGPMWDLALDRDNAGMLARADAAGIFIAAVCHGPAALLSAVKGNGKSLVSGRKVTGFSNREENLAGHRDDVPFSLEDALATEGAWYESGEPWQTHIVRDGNLLTGRNPQSAAALAECLRDLLNGKA